MKSLNEYINESLLDGLDDLEKDSDKAIESVLIQKFLNNNYVIMGTCTINNGIVDVNGSIRVKKHGIAKLTNKNFQFGTVTKSFDCSDCDNLTSLEGAPKEVGGRFFCSNCRSLKSLEGAPEKVGQDFVCPYCNSLTDLKGVPKEVGGSLLCHNCLALKSLKGAPEKVGRSFDCSECMTLTSLEGAPKEVKGNFICSLCSNIKSLKGAPKKVGRNFIADDCYINNKPIDDEMIEDVTDVVGKIII